MKNIPLIEIHKKLGARIIPFAGFNMPVEYSGIIDEHLAVRKNVGIFDVSHMGIIKIKGNNALDLLQLITTNDVSRLKPGKAQYSCFPNGIGGIVDDIIVYQSEIKSYFLVVNASNIEKDWNWINLNNKTGAVLENASDRMSLLAVQGPNSLNVLQPLTGINLRSIKPFCFVTGSMAGEENIVISATGYTGAGGLELYFDNHSAEKIWNAILESGKHLNIKPIGLAARDTLRLEMGYCLYGNDIDDTTSPIEAGLGWITKFTDYKEFIDKPLFQKQKTEGVKRKLVGLEMIDKGIPRHGYEVCDNTGSLIGQITSGTMSPSMKTGIGMGYVKTAFSIPGTFVFVKIRDKLLQARIVSFPIYKKIKSEKE